MDVKDFIKSKNISSSDFMDEGIVDLIESLINEYSNINIKKEISIVSSHDFNSLQEKIEWLSISSNDIINIQYEKSDGFFYLFYFKNEL